MATHLSVVNRILRRLREDQVATITANDYAELVGEFVADAYAEVAETHDWETLKHTVTVDLVAAQVKYDLTRSVTDGGDVRNGTARMAKVGSTLSFINDRPEVYIYDDNSTDQENGISFLTPEAFRMVKAGDRTETDEDPCYFTVYPDIDSTVSRLYLEVFPSPTTARVITLRFLTVPSVLEVDGTTDATTLLVPDRPVYHLALMYALNERGEEIGEPGNVAEGRYMNTLIAAIANDIYAYGKAERYDLVRR